MRLGIEIIITLFSFAGLYCTLINFKNSTINIKENRLVKQLIVFMLHCSDKFSDNIMRRCESRRNSDIVNAYWMLTFDKIFCN